MKKIVYIGIVVVSGACATTKTTATNSSSQNKETIIKNKKEIKDLPETKYPKSMDTSGTAPAPFKTGESRGF